MKNRNFNIAAVVVALGFAASAGAQVGGKAPPLWQNNAYDRMVLTDDKFYDIDPVRIPPGKMKDVEVVPNEVIKGGDGKDMKGLPPLREMARQAMYRIRMMDDGQEYYVKGASIKSLTYFEDLLLVEALRLIRAKQFDDAHPYLMTIWNLHPDWKGLFEAQVIFNRDEAIKLTQQFEFSKALVSLLEEKRIRDEGAAANKRMSADEEVGYQTIEQRIEDLAERWIRSVLDRRNYEEARKIVARFEGSLPNSGIGRKFREQFAANARTELTEGSQLVAAGRMHDAYVHIDRALQIAPDLEEARSAYVQFFGKHAVLKSGVERLSTYATGLTGWSAADWRCMELLHLPLERAIASKEGDAFESKVLEPLESAGTNKEVTVRIKQGLIWPGDSKPVTIVDVQRLLVDSCQSTSPFYHPAFARLVLGLELQGPNALLVRFDRPQFRPAIWLQIPFVRLSAIENIADGATLSRSGQGPYRYASRGSEESIFDANPRYVDTGKPLIREVIETPMLSAAERLRALETGRIDMTSYVPPRHLERAGKLPGVKVVRQALPRIHMLQFNMGRVEFRNRTLRRAIAVAINREGILANLGVKLDKENCLTTGPLPVGSFGYNAAIEGRPYDPILSRVLLQGVRRQFASMPTFRMSVSGNETERTAAAEIVKNLEKIGLKITLIDYEGTASADPLDGDLRYMAYTVTDPIYDLTTLLTRANPSLAVNASTWLRDKLVQLVQVPNPSAAKAILPEIHRILFDDVAVVPLWQLYDHFAVADSVGGLPKLSTSPYAGIADWTVKPRFPQAYWTPAGAAPVANGGAQ